MQGKSIKFNLDIKQYDLVQEFAGLVKMNRNKVAKHMLLVGIQNYMRAAEQERMRQLAQKDLAEAQEKQNVGKSVGVSEGSVEATSVSQATDTSEGQGPSADGTSPA